MSKDKLVSVAVVGTGYISDYHINGIRAAGSAVITSLVGRDADKTARRARQLGIAQSCTESSEVFSNPDIDAIVIATPDVTHKTLAIQALEANKCVLLQKPMAMSSDECRTILDAARRSSGSVTVSFMHRYFPEVRWLRERVKQGTFGKIHSVRIRNATPGAGWAEWLYDPNWVAGGVIMQLGIHGIDILQHLFGPITTVSAVSSTMKPSCSLEDGRPVTMQLEDNAAAIYELAEGFNATHEMSWTEVAGCDRFRLEVYFEDGTVWLRTDQSAALLNRGAGSDPTGWQPIELLAEPLGQRHHQHWLDVVRGIAPPDDTATAGLGAVVVAEHMYRSIAEGRRQSIVIESD